LRSIPTTAALAMAGASMPNMGIMPPSNPKLPPSPTIKTYRYDRQILGAEHINLSIQHNGYALALL